MGKRGFRRWRGAAALVLPLWLVLALAACGYHFAGGEDNIDPAIRTIFVETFGNQTSEAFAPNIFQSAFTSQFVQGGRFRLAASRETADAVFSGTILSLHTSSLSYRTANLAAEERMTVVLALTLDEKKSGRIIWTHGGFTGTGDYVVGAVGATEINRRNALVKLASETAERAYRLMMSGF